MTAPVELNDLGFDYKWNMGWMHDMLYYMQRDPVYRQHHHGGMTFGLVYMFSEHFILSISHDEVVHGKSSLPGKMPGDERQWLANLHTCLALVWTHPGKKLLFMSCEFGQVSEWSHDASPEQHLLGDPRRRDVQRLMHGLNTLYRNESSLHAWGTTPEKFGWVVDDDRTNSAFAFLRLGGDGRLMLVVANVTPIPREGYHIGAPPAEGTAYWREALNTGVAVHGGSDFGSSEAVDVSHVAVHGQGQLLVLRLPPLGVVVLKT